MKIDRYIGKVISTNQKDIVSQRFYIKGGNQKVNHETFSSPSKLLYLMLRIDGKVYTFVPVFSSTLRGREMFHDFKSCVQNPWLQKSFSII